MFKSKLLTVLFICAILCACTTVNSKDDLININVDLPDNGKLSLNIHKGWKYTVQESENTSPPTIEIKSEEGEDFLFLITPLWNPTTKEPIPLEMIKELMENESKELLEQAVEEEAAIRMITGENAEGYYFFLTDKAPKPGEYEFLIRAGVKVGNLLLSVTFLGNEEKADYFDQGLEMLKNVQQLNL